MPLTNKSVIITGASSGIGRAIALHLSKQYQNKEIGFVLGSRTYDQSDLKPGADKTPLLDLKQQIIAINPKAKILPFKLDVGDQKSVAKFTRELAKLPDFLEIGAFIHGAGTYVPPQSNDPKIAILDLTRLLSPYLIGFNNLLKHLLPIMNNARVVGFGSVSQGGNVDNAQYAMIKARVLDTLEYHRKNNQNNVSFTGIIQGYVEKNNKKLSKKNNGISLDCLMKYLTNILSLPPHIEISTTSPVATTTSLHRFSPIKKQPASYNPKDKNFMQPIKHLANIVVANPSSQLQSQIEKKGNIQIINEDISPFELSSKIDLFIIDASTDQPEIICEKYRTIAYNKMLKSGGRIVFIANGPYIHSYVSSLNAQLFCKKIHKLSYCGVDLGNNVDANCLAEYVLGLADIPAECSIEYSRVVNTTNYQLTDKKLI